MAFDEARPTRGGRRVTLKQVAEHLGLSPATVSIVLNRAPAADSIPPATQERVVEAARELGYRPNMLARSLRNQRSFSIGVLVPEISEGYAAAVIAGIEDHLLTEGFFYLVASHRSREDLLEKYTHLLKERLVEGLILVNTPMESSPGLPVVAVSGHTDLPGVTNVVIDHDRAALLALSHLAELGHRRIAFFKGHPISSDTEERWQGILTAAAELDLEVAPELTIQLGSDEGGRRFLPEEGYQEGYAFGRALLKRDQRFTALFAFNDISAIGAMRAFLDAGLSIPEDVSVVGFDDIQGAAFQNPGLTTVRQPLREMGEAAARILLEKLNADSPSSPIFTVTPELIVRGSTRRAPSVSTGDLQRGSD